MKKTITTLVLLLFTTVLLAQKKIISNSVPNTVSKISLKCECSKLDVYPYFYYQDSYNMAVSSLFLRFDFHHKGNVKCKPEFKGNITIYRSNEITVTIPLNTLTSYVNTDNQRIFVITQLNLPNSFRPMTIRGSYKITYSLEYGTSICPKTSSKIVRFTKDEPVL